MNTNATQVNGGNQDFTILPLAINQFLEIFYRLYPKDNIKNPERTIKKLLRWATSLFENHYLFQRYVFEIKDGVVVGVTMAFVLS